MSHLIFTDDIVLITELTSELQKMLQDIQETSKPVGLNMHMGKTEVMCNSVVNEMDISINGRNIEEVDSYIYLRQMVTKDHCLVSRLNAAHARLHWAKIYIVAVLNTRMCKY